MFCQIKKKASVKLNEWGKRNDLKTYLTSKNKTKMSASLTINY